MQQLSMRNVKLRVRIQGAAARFSALNDQFMRRVGPICTTARRNFWALPRCALMPCAAT